MIDFFIRWPSKMLSAILGKKVTLYYVASYGPLEVIRCFTNTLESFLDFLFLQKYAKGRNLR